MSAQTVITHALPQGARMEYIGTQSWDTDASTVTVVKPWGGLRNPLYVVRPDGMATPFTYVVAESELRPVVGVSLAKSSDRPNGVVMVPSAWELDRRGWGVLGVEPEAMPIGVVPALDRNDLRGLRVAFGTLARLGR